MVRDLLTMDVVFVLGLFVTTFLCVACEFEVFRSTVDWKGIKNICQLGTPNISIPRDSLSTVSLDLGVLNDGETAWLGYVLDYQVFQYIGCVRIEDIHNVNNEIQFTEVYTKPGPGYCSSACPESSVFGIGLPHKSCHCFHTNISKAYDRRWECDQRCNNDDFACGGDDVLSVYKKVDIPMEVVPTSDETRCLLYTAADDKYAWADCTEKHMAVCVDDRGIASLLGREYKWRVAADKCFHQQSYPTGYKTTSRQPTSEWTALIQTQSIQKLNEGTKSSAHRMLGYVERRGDVYRLQFTDNQTLSSKAICVNGTISVPKTPQDERPVVTEDGDGDTNTSVGLYVGVSIGILLAIILIIVVVVIWKKRLSAKNSNLTSSINHRVNKSINDEHEDSNYSDPQQNRPSVTYEELTNGDINDRRHANNIGLRDMENSNNTGGSTEYDYTFHSPGHERDLETSLTGKAGKTNYVNSQAERESNMYSSAYSTVDKENTHKNAVKGERSNAIPEYNLDDGTHAYDKTYVESPAYNVDTYDHIGSKMTTHDTPTNNDTDQTYDSTNDAGRPSQDTDTYDHIGSKMTTHDTTTNLAHTDQTYDVGSPAQNADTYDHIGGKVAMHDMNTYDKLPTDETYDSTSRIGVNDDQVNGDDLYSHTNPDDYSSINASVRRGTGNVYS